MKEFLAMGGYAVYVWPSFGLTFIVMALIILGSRLQRSRAVDMVKRKAQIDENKTDH